MLARVQCAVALGLLLRGAGDRGTGAGPVQDRRGTAHTTQVRS